MKKRALREKAESPETRRQKEWSPSGKWTESWTAPPAPPPGYRFSAPPLRRLGSDSASPDRPAATAHPPGRPAWRCAPWRSPPPFPAFSPPGAGGGAMTPQRHRTSPDKCRCPLPRRICKHGRWNQNIPFPQERCPGAPGYPAGRHPHSPSACRSAPAGREAPLGCTAPGC